tara:strand:- start:2995 stop:3768 length:774 start_codon:yes stop_codon:yes gene_type:complete
MNKINLKDCTFIVPVKLESEDRIRNSEIVLNFLNETFDTQIIIYEFGTEKIPDIIDISSDNITYIKEESKDKEAFHRTAMLNKMIKMVNTKVVANYDVDVILPIESYKKSIDKILNEKFDLIYPYGIGFYQKMVNTPKKELISSKNIFESMNSNCILERAEVGHVQFFKTSSYIEGGMENEGFVSYGPEDKERAYRFEKLGFKVGRNEDPENYVYHLEHERSHDSNHLNPYFTKNFNLWNSIQKMNETELKNYYQTK